MRAITIIHRQLCEILHLMQDDLKRKEYVNNYFICEDDCKLLPKQEIQEYLTTTKIENTFLLLSVNKLCVEIIEIWNGEFMALKMKEFDKTFRSKRGLIATTFFKAIYLTEEKWHFYNSIESKQDFTENRNYKNYQIADIAKRCTLIFNWITASYPDTGTNIIEKYHHEHYLKTGRFYFQIFVKAFYSAQFEFASNKLENFEKSYLYIIDNLDNNKRIEFKHDTLDHLRRVKEIQELSKFKVLIENVIQRIEGHSNYNGLNLSRKDKAVEKEVKYVLANDFFDNLKGKHRYKSFTNEIERNGFKPFKYKGDKLKVYTPELTYLLSVDNYEASNSEDKSMSIVDNFALLDAFHEGYLNGERFYTEDYKVPAKTLYSDNIESYLSVLREKYLHTGYKGMMGWNYVKTSDLITITKRQIKELGYYSGIVSKVDEMIEKHPQIFVHFYEDSEHGNRLSYIEGKKEIENLDSQQSKTINKKQILSERNNLIPGIITNEVYDFFKVLITKPNRKGDFYLSEQKLLIFIKATFIDERPIKQKFDVAFSKDKIDVRSVFKRFQDYCYDLEYNKTYVKDKYFNLMVEAFEGFSKTTDFNKWHKTNNKLPTIKRHNAK